MLAAGKRGPSKFTPEVAERFLEHVRKTGRKHEAAQVSGVSYDCIRVYINKNINEMADRTEAAMADYREAIEAEIHRRAIEGVPEPIIGGKDRDEIVTYVQRYSDRLLEFHAKRHIPEYRSAQQIDLNVRGGVIAVPAQAPSMDAWIQAAGEAALPTIDLTPEPAGSSDDS